MLSARQCETWLTLDELSKLTHYPPASISAQLRHLRKPEYGGYAVEKRPRAVGKVLRGEDFGTIWEYQLRRVIRRKLVAARLRGGAAQTPRQSVARWIAPRRHGGTMSVKPELAFDVCWEVYRGAREVLETKRGISALNWKDTGKFLWRPDFRPRLNEWVADFALAGKAALDGPGWASRMVLFRVYYLGLAPYENARHFIGLSEHSWVNWTEQIRHRCGKEMLGRGMFPPRRYFVSAD
jgi:hypothetical protein